jgi:hypothetical protein
LTSPVASAVLQPQNKLATTSSQRVEESHHNSTTPSEN